MKWEILSKKGKDIIKTLLKNRGINNEKEFFNPKDPKDIKLADLGIDKSKITKAVKRIEKAKKNKEKVIVYGDYDADGICATAILWEGLYSYGLDVMPYIPDRFEEGYGINAKSVEELKNSKIPDLKLIITVDNGIVAYEGIKKAKELEIDVIVIDHHAKEKKTLSDFVIHTTLVCGSALAYFFAKELGNKKGLDLAAIGTIADQMALTGINRSIAKFGLPALESTKRPGLLALYKSAGIENVGTYEVNFIIAPRINAMGRLSHGIDSLRLLCTTKEDKAKMLANLLNQTNMDRQGIVEKVVLHAREQVGKEKIIILSHESYHEGVIGLAAGRIADEFYRPAIVISKKEGISKASARSISGFNIIDVIRNLKDLYLEGGGHPMAAGFSIQTENIDKFSREINKLANKFLTDDMLEKKLRIDMELDFSDITWELYNNLTQFDPTGMGNPGAVFATKDVGVIEMRPVGREAKHIKLKVKQGDSVLEAIYFNAPNINNLSNTQNVNIAYQIDANTWNNSQTLQLKIKDLVVVNQ